MTIENQKAFFDNTFSQAKTTPFIDKYFKKLKADTYGTIMTADQEHDAIRISGATDLIETIYSKLEATYGHSDLNYDLKVTVPVRVDNEGKQTAFFDISKNLEATTKIEPENLIATINEVITMYAKENATSFKLNIQ